MADFVLVAGAFHGAWAWRAVAPYLHAHGHVAHRLDLTGQGARLHNATVETGLATHVADVVSFVNVEELTDIVLVGHSYAGMVVTGAARELGSKVAHLVYLDAMVPRDGQSAADVAGPLMTASALAATGAGWLTPFFLPVSKFGPFADAREEQWFLSKVEPHPLKAFLDPIVLGDWTPPARSFIYCSGDPLGIFDGFARTAARAHDWGYYELPTGHDPMITAPRDVARILCEIAAGV